MGAAAAGGGSVAGKMIGGYASSVVAGGTREEGAVGLGLRTPFKRYYAGVSGEIRGHEGRGDVSSIHTRDGALWSFRYSGEHNGARSYGYPERIESNSIRYGV